jgi:hypothetical protein
MTLPLNSIDPAYRIYLTLAQYPTLRRRIRTKMRNELFERGILTSAAFEEMVRHQAIDSQQREGVVDALSDEAPEEWKLRLDVVRDQLTDLSFANNLPFDIFERLVKDVLAERGAESEDLLRTFNPELASQEALFEQAQAISRMAPEQRRRHEAREREIKVVLLKSMISDQLAYINIAKDWFTLDDLLEIRRYKIGKGKVGGKAAGMLLALRILQAVAEEDIVSSVDIPDSYFLGADVMYAFMSNNGMMHWADQKYKDETQIHDEFEQIQQEYAAGSFPEDILTELSIMLEKIGKQPIIVRSSSLLEDNFGSSFAGKYASFFCPNQASHAENLRALTQAIAAVYASALNPDALLYRRSHGLEDYDERLAVLIQVVQGEAYGRYYFPHFAGVAFSRNMFRWSPQIKRHAGFVRLVAGMGTRAVDQVGNDYPRLVALSHPELRAQRDPRDINVYSQHFIDVIDLQDNAFKTLPVGEVLDGRYPHLRLAASQYKDGDLSPIRSSLAPESQLVLTFDGVVRNTPFAERMRRILAHLEKKYSSPVDMEFTLRVHTRDAKPEIELFILQCRPQSHLNEVAVRLPELMDKQRIVFSTSKAALHGRASGIRYALFVTPEGYYGLPNSQARGELTRAISKINKLLEGEEFICVGPGRWGTSTPDLGVSVSYADIYNTRALVELSGAGLGPAPEPSYGTHFFQDLIESRIYPLAVHLDDADAIFNRSFFYEGRNHLLDWAPELEGLQNTLRLLHVEDSAPGQVLELIMDSEAGRTVAFFEEESKNE